MLYKVLKSCLKKIPADIETDVKPRKYQNKKNGTNASQLFTEVSPENLKFSVKQAFF